VNRPIPLIALILALTTLVGCGAGGTPIAPSAAGAADVPGAPIDDDLVLEVAIAEFMAEPNEATALQQELSVREIFETSNSHTAAWARVDGALADLITDAEALAQYEEASRALGGYVANALPEETDALRNRSTGAPYDTLLLYVNGIATTKCGFDASVEALAPVARDALRSVWTSGVYNVSARDAEESYFGTYVCPITDKLPDCDEKIDTICEGVGWVIDLREAARQKLFGLFGATPIETVGQAREIAERIEDGVARGMRVIVVAHSQGNFFARDALKILAKEDSPALEGVAVIMMGSPEPRSGIAPLLLPESRVAVVQNSSDVVAQFGDLICGGDDGCVPTSVDALPWSTRHHSFVEGYLEGTYTQARFKKLLKELDAELKLPFPTTSIEVTVKDESGYSLQGVKVELMKAIIPGVLDTQTTGSSGFVSFDELDPLLYDVRASLSGYDTKTNRLLIEASDRGYVVSTTITLKKKAPTTGALTVTVYKPDKSTVFAGAKVQLIDSSGAKVGTRVTTSSSGKATWSAKTPGSYSFKVYHTNTGGGLSLEEYWGKGTATITAGQTAKVTFNRYMPYASNLLIGLSGTSTWLNASSSVTSGSNIYFKIPIIHAASSNQTVKAYAILDRSKTKSFDYVGSTSETSIKPNSKGYHFINTTAPTNTGTYYTFIEVLTKVGGNWVRTDSWAWTGAFKVK
jgi:hypothetical protein